METHMHIPVEVKGTKRNRFLLLLAVIALFLVATGYLNIDFETFISRVRNTPDVLRRMSGLDAGAIPSLLNATGITVFLSFVSGTLSTIFAFFLSFLSAENTTPWKWLGALIKAGVAIIRSIPSLIMALMIVSAIGFGNTPAIFVMTLSGTSTLTRLFTGSIEEVDVNIIEAISATGSSRIGVIIHGILPTVITAFLSWMTIHIESTISLSISLGVLGIEGIGLLLSNAQMNYQYTTITTIVLYIFILMFILEFFTTQLRERINHGH